MRSIKGDSMFSGGLVDGVEIVGVSCWEVEHKFAFGVGRSRRSVGSE